MHVLALEWLICFEAPIYCAVTILPAQLISNDIDLSSQEGDISATLYLSSSFYLLAVRLISYGYPGGVVNSRIETSNTELFYLGYKVSGSASHWLLSLSR